MDAIGSVLSGTNNTSSATTLNQNDFIKLFLTQLNFQDPMEPVDNREFLAQIAQFSSLEQAKETSDKIDDLVTLNSTSQSVTLLGKFVEVISDTSANGAGTVSAVRFTSEGPLLTVTMAASGTVMSDVKLSQISLVR
jgi:flagellar basal-body rod modification protein FlgD